MRSNLIDQNGTVWLPDSRSLLTELGTSLRGEALTAFLIRNMGWLSLMQTDNRIRITCRPALLCDATIAELLEQLFQQRSPLIALNALMQADAWTHTIFGDLNTFVRYLSAVVDGERKPQRGRTRLLKQSKTAGESRLAKVARLAQTVGQGCQDVAEARPVFDELFDGRWSLFAIDDVDKSNTSILAHGTGYTPFNPNWLAKPIGRSLKDYGDLRYAAWVSEQQCEASTARQIRYDDVDALVDFKTVGPTRLRYSRALVPIRRHCGRRLVLSAAVTDSSINLRSRVFQEMG
jgi:hypothetical protein